MIPVFLNYFDQDLRLRLYLTILYNAHINPQSSPPPPPPLHLH